MTGFAISLRRELARLRGLQLRIAREKASLNEAERVLVSLLSDAVAKNSTHYQLTQTQSQRWQASESEVTARLADFDRGRSPINVVLQSQQRRSEAQVDYYRALAEYEKSTTYVSFLNGTMLANSDIILSPSPH